MHFPGISNYAIQHYKKVLSFLLLPLFLSACGSPPVTPPLPAVTVAKPISKEVTDFDEYSGYLESPETAVVSARVSGIIIEAPFTEGSLVKAGDVLFVLDDRPFRADVASKEAELAKSQAGLAVAKAQISRYDSVKGTRAISAQDYDQAVASHQQAQAQVASANAALTVSKLNLEWSRVSAPISGRVGRKMITVGNLVNGGAGAATQLTSITSVDPMFAYINVPERSFLKYKQIAGGGASLDSASALPCEAQLENQTSFTHKGIIDFIDNHVDPATGTMQMRCALSNVDSSLSAGLFVRTRVQSSKPYSPVLIPNLAVGTDQNTKFVLLIGPEGTVQSRSVKLGNLFGKLRVITEGLSLSDSIVVNGLQAARPGSKVNPSEVQITPEGLVPTPAPAITPTA